MQLTTKRQQFSHPNGHPSDTLQDSSLNACEDLCQSHHACKLIIDYVFQSTCSDEEPLTFDKAKEDCKWTTAMKSEYDSIMHTNTRYLIELPPSKKPMVSSGHTSSNRKLMVQLTR